MSLERYKSVQERFLGSALLMGPGNEIDLKSDRKEF